MWKRSPPGDALTINPAATDVDNPTAVLEDIRSAPQTSLCIFSPELKPILNVMFVQVGKFG